MSLVQSTVSVAAPAPSTAALSPREQRGRQLAAIAKIRQSGPIWLVPSQSDDSTYKLIVRANWKPVRERRDHYVWYS